MEKFLRVADGRILGGSPDNRAYIQRPDMWGACTVYQAIGEIRDEATLGEVIPLAVGQDVEDVVGRKVRLVAQMAPRADGRPGDLVGILDCDCAVRRYCPATGETATGHAAIVPNRNPSRIDRRFVEFPK